MLRKSRIAIGTRNVNAPAGVAVASLLVLAVLCSLPLRRDGAVEAATTIHGAESKAVSAGNLLHIEKDEQTRVIRVYRDDGSAPILTENAYDDTRPYIHPIVAPDGKGVLTEFRPWHHPHQMGIYWGFKWVNGRDYFMHWQNDYYRKVSATVVQKQGQQVKWQTVYDMVDATGTTILTETQDWTMEARDGKYILDLQWQGVAKTAIVVNQYYVGGLFVRMPWHPGEPAEAINSNGQRDKDAEAKRANWVDLGVQVDGRNDLTHLVVFDSPKNSGFPVSWRVDDQYGFGPDRSWQEWKMEKGQTESLRYRIIAYTGKFNSAEIVDAFNAFAAGN